MDQMDGQNDSDDAFIRRVKRPAVTLVDVSHVTSSKFNRSQTFPVSTKAKFLSRCWLCSSKRYKVGIIIATYLESC